MWNSQKDHTGFISETLSYHLIQHHEKGWKHVKLITSKQIKDL